MQNIDLKKYKIPDKPGVYFFMQGSNMLYIGKATSLKDRVKSYFGKDLFNTRGPLLVDMITKAESIKWHETDSVLEALILEANLIKKYQPIYNSKEKSDKSFNYVCITKDRKIALVRGKNLKSFAVQKFSDGQNEASARRRKLLHSETFGPFPNGSQLREALRIIRKIFPYIEDRRGAKGKEEFYKQIKLFPADSKENINNIKNIKLFFEGKKTKIFKNLEKEMQSLAKEHKFEQANEVKKQLFALKHINDVALIKEDGLVVQKFSHIGTFRVEAYDIAHMSGKDMVGVMVVIEDSESNKNEYRKFKIKNYSNANDTGALLEVLERRFAHPEWQYPKLIVIDGGKAQLNVIKKFQEKVGLAIPAVSVVKDERHKAKDILGDKDLINRYGKEILLANHEAHRFAITYHRKLRGKIV